MRARVLLLAAALAVAGFLLGDLGAHTTELLTLTTDPETALSVGDEMVFVEPTMSTRALIGQGLVWLATLLVAGVIGHWLATRRSRPLD
ncbi:MAG: hypothetical protein JWP31_1548 [Aeromicrobium sp.]|nr:hypothetical protein [Aeromicrobium sp.]